ncbi:VOC family protein [Dactylosporangium vinaceum]|uniref:VOC family protein n=1 Tax=Dactylosporangium vinaceum TaxID=53362 RepID=A0ABV5M5P5_9ACTN|nr:VOC family protein [Dactylosporangium vinaceum]UAB95623.1 VOC family protein [Dactylosporangium vinaceum]
MPSSKGASSNDGRKLVIASLMLFGGFLAMCGLGQSKSLVVALGVLVIAAGPVALMVINNRNRVRLFVQGTAVVEDITTPSTQGARSARAKLRLTITATGIRGVSVTGVDPAVPLDRWPERGAVLPVQVLKGNPRKFTVLWDRVQTHQEVGRSGGDNSLGELEEDFAALNAAHLSGGNGAAGDNYTYDSDEPYRRPDAYAQLPADNTPTLTNLPPVEAEIDEPAGAVATVAPPADAPRQSLRERLGFPPRQATRPRHAAGDPVHHPPAPLGGDGEGPGHTPLEPLDATPPAAGPVVTEDEAATPAPGPREAAEPVVDEPAAAEPMVDEDAAATATETITDEPEAQRPTVIGEEDEPIIMRLRSAPRPGGHRRPSPHPRSGAHDRVRRTRPGRSHPVSADPPPLPPTLTPPPPEPQPEPTAAQPLTAQPPAAEPLTADPLATESLTAEPLTADPLTTESPTTGSPGAESLSADPRAADPRAAERRTAEPLGTEPLGTEPPGAGPVEMPRAAEATVIERPETRAEPDVEASDTFTIPESDSQVPPPEPDPNAGAEVEWWMGADDPRPQVAYYPDRESEAPPTRALYTPPPVIEGELADPAAAAAEPMAGTQPVIDAEPEPKSGSAWSANGRGPVPVGAGLYSAPPVFRAPVEDEDDEDGEPVAPDPYATEHYLPSDGHVDLAEFENAADEDEEDADRLEEQALPNGAVAEFLAAGPRKPTTMPLDGVNGVSITLIVSDLQRSRRFYRDTLGLTELDSGDTSAVLETGSARVVLRRVADMPPVDRRVVHLNLDVPDVYEAYERLREQGVDFVHRPRVVPQGEQLELCSATFRDPDGHAIALTRWELRR